MSESDPFATFLDADGKEVWRCPYCNAPIGVEYGHRCPIAIEVASRWKLPPDNKDEWRLAFVPGAE